MNKTLSWNMYDAHGKMTTRQIKSKTAMLKLSLWDYSDKHILEKGTITIARETDTKAVGPAEKRNKGVIFKKLCTIHWLYKWNK